MDTIAKFRWEKTISERAPTSNIVCENKFQNFYVAPYITVHGTLEYRQSGQRAEEQFFWSGMNEMSNNVSKSVKTFLEEKGHLRNRGIVQKLENLVNCFSKCHWMS